MDMDLESTSLESPQSTVLGQTNGVSAAACALCQRILSSDNDTGDLEAINICGDCKFLFLEDLESPIQEAHHRRRISRLRRPTRFSSSESIEDLFSQQFSHMINLARQNQPNFAENENQYLDDDGAARLQQRSSSRTTPSGSRRWRRVLSDTESDGLDSLYGESESNVSFGGYRNFPGESDTISYSAYGGDSDVSVDGRSFMDTEIFGDLDSDSDIDPMHTGLNQWNLDYQEEEEDEEEDTEWEEADAEENTVETFGGGTRSLRRISSSNERSGLVNWHGQSLPPPPEFDTSLFHNLQDSELAHYVVNSGDYLDSRGFEELLEHFAVTDSSRRGAPPAAMSCVNSLPKVVINEKHDGLACAICKEFLCAGTVVNELPCCHLYHNSCILPWLSARNTCPLCRYELPTDDKDYEERKRNTTSNALGIHEIEQEGTSDDDSSSDISTYDEACELGNIDGVNERSSRESPRGRWLFLAAAPIVSLVGIALVLWLGGNPLTERRRGQTGHSVISEQGRQMGRSLSSNRSRRWWSLF